MIKIIENRKGLQCGGLYHVKTDSGQAVLVHNKTRKSVRLTFELLRKIKHEYIPDNELAM